MNNEKFGIELDLVVDNFKKKMQDIQDMTHDLSRGIKLGFTVDYETVDKELGLTIEKLQNKFKDVNFDFGINGDTSVMTNKDNTNFTNRYNAMTAEQQQEVDNLLVKIKELQLELNKLSSQEGIAGVGQKVGEDARSALNNIKAIFNNEGNTGKLSQDLQDVDNKLNDVDRDARKGNKGFILLKNGSNQLNNSMRKMSAGLQNGVKSLKRFALSLFGVQSAYMAVRRAVSAYLSYDSDLQQSIQNTWAGLGSMLAPVIEYLVALFQKFLAYVNAVVKALTGVDYVARANQKSLDKTASSASNASKALAGFDEINNINQSSGSGSSANQISIPDIDTTTIDNMIDKIKEMFKNGQYYEIGDYVAENIADALDSIPWEKIQNKCREIAKGVAELLNGFFGNKHLFTSIGNTLGEGINTILYTAQTFMSTFDWKNFGDSLGLIISTTIKTIDWSAFFSDIFMAINALATTLSGVIEGVDWSECTKKIVEGMFSDDSINSATDAVDGISKLAGDLVALLIEAIIVLPFQIGQELGKKFVKSVEDSVDEYWDKGGTSIAGSILAGINGPFETITSWIADHIFTPFAEGIAETFDISGDGISLEAVQWGYSIVTGLLNIMEYLIPGSSWLFESMKKSIDGKMEELKKSTVTSAGESAGGIHDNLTKGTNSTASEVGKNMKDVATNVKGGLNGVDWNSIKSNWVTGFKSVLNGVSQKFNTWASKFKSNTSFSIVGAFKTAFKALTGINLTGAGSIFNIVSNIPMLKVGTDLVKEEGMAYLHKGESVVPADVVSGGFTGNNDETNNLLRSLISAVQDKDYNPIITVDDIGKASVNYINRQNRITGRSIV